MSTAEATLDTRQINPFAVAGRTQGNSGGMIAVASSREAQLVQAQMAIAQRCPRNQEVAWTRIMTACQRKALAEGALYSYPRGGQQITGPSIRLAEALAQNWGNLDFGVVELEQRNGESTVMAYCVDLETNTRQAKIFQVPHTRKAGGEIKTLDDPRDVYELIANMGARRLRSCILGIIPGDVIEAAVDQCEKTLKGSNQAPLIDRIRVMATKFQEDFNVSVAMLEKRLAHKLEATNEQEMVGLRKIFTSLKDGMSKREDWFEHVDKVESAQVSTPTPPPANEAGQSTPGQSSAPEGTTGEHAGAEAPKVPNETLGAKKEKAPKKEKAAAPAPEAGSRQAMVAELRQKFVESGCAENEFLNAAVGLEITSPATSLTALGSDILKAMVERYAEIVAQIS